MMTKAHQEEQDRGARSAGEPADVIELAARRAALRRKEQAPDPPHEEPPPRRVWPWRLSAAGLAGAVALLCVWWWQQTGPPLPLYSIATSSEHRYLGSPRLGGDPAAERIPLSPESRLLLILRPEQKLATRPYLTAYRQRVGQALELWPQGETGSWEQNIYRLDRRVQELGLTYGRWQLIFVISRSRLFPSFDEVSDLRLGTQAPGVDAQWQVRTLVVDIDVSR